MKINIERSEIKKGEIILLSCGDCQSSYESENIAVCLKDFDLQKETQKYFYENETYKLIYNHFVNCGFIKKINFLEIIISDEYNKEEPSLRQIEVITK